MFIMLVVALLWCLMVLRLWLRPVLMLWLGALLRLRLRAILPLGLGPRLLHLRSRSLALFLPGLWLRLRTLLDVLRLGARCLLRLCLRLRTLFEVLRL